MAAAGVCPAVREQDLVGGPLLQQQLATGVEEEDAERTVKGGAGKDVGHEVTMFLGPVADYLVSLIHQNTLIFVEESELLLVVLLG